MLFEGARHCDFGPRDEQGQVSRVCARALGPGLPWLRSVKRFAFANTSTDDLLRIVFNLWIWDSNHAPGSAHLNLGQPSRHPDPRKALTQSTLQANVVEK